MLTYNYHTHTYLCHHATGTPEEYVLKAIGAGIKKMGFSDHCPFKFPDGYQSISRVKVEEVSLYRDEILRLKEKYREEIEIHIGFEMEYFPEFFSEMLENAKKYGAEYLILGQHFHGPEHFGFEHAICEFADNLKLQKYVDTMIEGINTGAFTYVAHPDMLNFIGDKEVFKSEMKRLCIGAKEAGIPFEINFLGIRGKRIYPKEKFWEIAGKVGVKAVFGLDAHDPDGAADVSSLNKAEEIAEKYGVKIIEPELRYIGEVKK